MLWFRHVRPVKAVSRWLFVLFGLFPLHALGEVPMGIVLPNGATLPMSRAFPNLLWMEHKENKLLKGFSDRHQVFFTVTVFEEGGEDATQLAEMLQHVLDVENMLLTPLEEPNQDFSPNTLIFRLTGDSIYNGYLVGFVRSRANQESVVFCIMGPEAQFYEKSQAFWDMLTGYKPSPGSVAGQLIVKPWMVVIAIVVFLLNTVTLWYGFRQMAVARSLELEEGP